MDNDAPCAWEMSPEDAAAFERGLRVGLAPLIREMETLRELGEELGEKLRRQEQAAGWPDIRDSEGKKTRRQVHTEESRACARTLREPDGSARLRERERVLSELIERADSEIEAIEFDDIRIRVGTIRHVASTRRDAIQEALAKWAISGELPEGTQPSGLSAPRQTWADEFDSLQEWETFLAAWVAVTEHRSCLLKKKGPGLGKTRLLEKVIELRPGLGKGKSLGDIPNVREQARAGGWYETHNVEEAILDKAQLFAPGYLLKQAAKRFSEGGGGNSG
jgi:hypothetical protein